MNHTNQTEFTSILKSTMEVYDKALSADALRLWWATMQNTTIEQFRQAMTAHITTSQFSPKPADILNQLRKQDGRPGAEEAWSMIPKDEYGSVVWTTEMATAYGVASPLLAEGDSIGARMAFKEAYQREVEINHDQPAHWMPSFGFEKSGREQAVVTAVQKNRLTIDRALKLLPESEQILQLSGEDTTPQLENQQAIKQLLSGVVDREER